MTDQVQARELAAMEQRALEAERRLDEARAENDVNHGWLYCPMCGSCGIGGCCGYLCDFCRARHDGETQDGSPPSDLGDLRLMQGGWKERVGAAESRALAAEAEAKRLREALVEMVEEFADFGALFKASSPFSHSPDRVRRHAILGRASAALKETR